MSSLRRVLFCLCLSVAVSVPASVGAQSDDWRDGHYAEEAHRIEPYKDRIKRDGEHLTLRLGNGERVLLVSSPDGCEGSCKSYFFESFNETTRYYVIHIIYYESEGYRVVSANNGEQADVVGCPAFEPSGRRFIAVLNDDRNGYAIQMWRLREGGPSLEFTFEPPQSYEFIGWSSPDQVDLVAREFSASEEPGTALHLIRINGGWRLRGAGIDRAIGSANSAP